MSEIVAHVRILLDEVERLTYERDQYRAESQRLGDQAQHLVNRVTAERERANEAARLSAAARERDQGRDALAAMEQDRDRLREQALRLNRPMVARLHRCAADTSSNWDGQITIYPPEARELIALIDAVRVPVESEPCPDHGKAVNEGDITGRQREIPLT